MNSATRLLIQSLQMPRTKQKPIQAKVAEGKCIIADCDCDLDRRGLCTSHYNQFCSELRRLDSDERVEFESKMIAKGMILPPYEQGTMRRKNVFADAMRAG